MSASRPFIRRDDLFIFTLRLAAFASAWGIVALGAWVRS